MKFKNFHIWRKRLPHWRADGVLYYVTFRHKRPLEEAERRILFTKLLAGSGKRWDLRVLSVLPEQTELMLVLLVEKELSDLIEKAKGVADRQIRKKTSERWPLFYSESFDRIVRDEAEAEETLLRMAQSASELGPTEDPADSDTWFLSEG